MKKKLAKKRQPYGVGDIRVAKVKRLVKIGVNRRKAERMSTSEMLRWLRENRG